MTRIPMKCFAIITAFIVVEAGQVEAEIQSPNTWGFISREFDFIEVNRRLFAGNSSTSPEEFRAVLEFDLNAFSSLPEPVFLNLETGREGGALDFDLYGYLGDGLIDRDDYDAGSDSLASFNLSSPGTLSFDVSAFVNTNLAAGDKILGFNIRPAVPGGFPQDTTWGFDAVGLGDFGEVAPLVPIPEPSTAALTYIGFISLLTWRRKKPSVI